MPRRFPRPAVAGLAVGLAAASIALGSMPALASSVRQQEWWLAKLDVRQAWHSSRGSGVTVAVLSDGVNAAQSDLDGSVIAGSSYAPGGRTPAGPYFGLAGTAVASLIAGHGHGAGRSAGLIGIAPAARILSVRVTLSPADPLLASKTIAADLPDAIAAGIRFAVGEGATVIDLPLDPGRPGVHSKGARAAAGGSPAERAAVAYALRKGVVLVAPAGDDGARGDALNYPAAYPGVISVGAFNQDFVKAPYSSHRSYVTLTAAGDQMVVAAVRAGYTTMSSTSAASAIVAGMAALIRSSYPELTPVQVRKALTRSTKIRPAGGRADGSGYGTADAAAAMAKASVLAAGVQRAGSLSVPRAAPKPPRAAPSQAEGIAPQLLRAGVIAAGILVLLLLLVSIYAAAQRRQARRAAAAAAKWDRPAPSRSAPSGTAAASASASAADAAADPLLAYFSAPTSGRPRPPEASLQEARPRPRPAGPASPPGSRPPAAHGGPGGHGGSGGRGGRGGRSGRGANVNGRDASAAGRGGAASQPATRPGAGQRPGAGEPAGQGGPRSQGGPPWQNGQPGQGGQGGQGGQLGQHEPVGQHGPGGEPGRGSFAGTSGRAGAGDPFAAASDPHEPDGGQGGAGNRGARPALGPAPRPASRQPRVSGAPPWDPAAEPESELPWATAPAPSPHASAARKLRPAAPRPAAPGRPGSAWTAAQAPPPAAPRPGGDSIWDSASSGTGNSSTAREHSAAGKHDADADPGSAPDRDRGSRPIYVWNPAESTETFPAVRRD